MRAGHTLWISIPAIQKLLESWDEYSTAAPSAQYTLSQRCPSREEFRSEEWDGASVHGRLLKLSNSGFFGTATSNTSRPAKAEDAQEPLDGREEERRTGETSQGLWRQNQSYDKSGKQKRIYPYDKAASLAEEFREDLENLKTLLEQQGVQLPKSRFYENNAELMRFAFTTGLTTAESPAERMQAIKLAAARIADSAEWLHGHHFSSAADLLHWQPLLHWVERPELLYPLLKIEIGKATQSCDGAQLDNYAEAIISQVEMAMESKFSDNFGHPEQMVVIANCQGASSMQGSNVFKLIKYVSLTLNKHYPGRLHRFYLVDIPRILRWPVKAVIALGHPSTREKIILCDSDDRRLPESSTSA